jgi:3-dehydrosphinganine reductase
MPHVIITGGSSGIGLEVARIYLSRGYRLTLMSRKIDLLRAAEASLSLGGLTPSNAVHLVAVDVSHEESVRTAVYHAETVHGPCDVLVTSAGRVDPEFFDMQSSDVFAAQIDVNFFGSVHAVRAVYDGMKVRRRGRIMLVSSGAAWIGIPAYTAYCASKSALAGFSEALRAEAMPHGVSISICYPPDTLTPQYVQEIKIRPDVAHRVMGMLDPWRVDKVAQLVVDGTERGKAQVHFGLSLKLLASFGAFIKPALFWLAARGTAVKRQDNT